MKNWLKKLLCNHNWAVHVAVVGNEIKERVCVKCDKKQTAKTVWVND